MKKLKFNKELKIGSKVISENSPSFIIAEAGVNHNGDIKLAEQLIDAACEAGVDAIKFQSFKTEHLILSNIDKAPYQKKTTASGETQYQMLRRLEMNDEQIKYIKCYCENKNILMLSTPFEEISLQELVELGLPAIKIAATDLTNIKFLRQAAQTGKIIILSAGMCYSDEIERALEVIYPHNKNVILLQCTANYPIQDIEANLKVIQSMKEKFNIIVGYSDHSEGIGASPYAVAIGAKVIEKHFTLDKTMDGPDHRASITPKELAALVTEIRKVEKYLGTGIKIPTISEQQTRKSLQKYLVAKKEILIGEIFNNENIDAKRTGGVGISAIYFDDIVGQFSEKHYQKDDIIVL